MAKTQTASPGMKLVETMYAGYVEIPESTIIGGKLAISCAVRLGKRCNLHDNVALEDGTVLGDDAFIASGVKIPSYWKIPENCIVNPGVDGFPVVIPKPQSFRCNINGQLSTGYR